MNTLGSQLPVEIARVRDEVLPVYEKLGDAGNFAVYGMRRDLAMAEKAIEIQDAVMMLRCYSALRGWEL